MTMNQDLLFIHLLTNGLDIQTAEVVSIAAIRTSPSYEIQATMARRVSFEGTIDAEATGIAWSPDAWRDAVPFRRAMEELHRIATGPGAGPRIVVVAHHAGFPEAVLRSQCRRSGLEFPLGNRSWIDTAMLAWIPMWSGAIKDRNLSTLANLYDVAPGDGSPDSEVHVIRDVFERMMVRFEIGQRVESTGREIVGKISQGVMEFINGFGKATGTSSTTDKEKNQNA